MLSLVAARAWARSMGRRVDGERTASFEVGVLVN
jgi:hypothetical protein